MKRWSLSVVVAAAFLAAWFAGWRFIQPWEAGGALNFLPQVKLPWPLPKVEIGSWGKPSDAHSNSGVYHYDLPSALAGYDIPLVGAHTERGVVCGGAVIIRFKGGGFGNPALIGALVLLVVSGVGLVVSFKPKFG